MAPAETVTSVCAESNTSAALEVIATPPSAFRLKPVLSAPVPVDEIATGPFVASRVTPASAVTEAVVPA